MRCASAGSSRRSAIPGPTIQSLPIIRRSTGHIVVFSISITSGISGASWSTRLSAVKLKLMTRAGRPGAVPAEVLELLDQPLLHQAAVPGRVLGLDGHLHATVVVRHGLQQLAQGQHPVQRLVADRRLVVELGPRVLPRRDVQLLELGELQGRDGVAPAGGTAQVAVVDADEVPVGGEPDVALEALGPGVECRDVRAQRVLGVLVAGASVGDDLGAPGRAGTHRRIMAE